MGINYTPKTWTDGPVVHASDLNTEIRDLSNGLQGAWTAFTPALTNITLGNGSLSVCKYYQVGKTVRGRVGFAAGSTTTYSAGQLLIACPVTPHADYNSGSLNATNGVGIGFVNPAGTRQPVAVTINGSNQFQLMTTSGNAIVTNTVPGTFGTSGLIGFEFEYEAA